MAFLFPADELVKRQYYNCPSGYYYSNGRCRERSSWSWWGRWVLTGMIIFAFILLLCCLGSRRRRKRGRQPMYGTGWMTNNRFGGGPHQQPQQQPQYGQGYNQQQQQGGYHYGQQQQPQYGYGQGEYNAPPAYGQPPPQPQHTGQTFTPGEGYYGGHDGIQLQQPPQAYSRGVDGDFSPPPGPPPAKA
ncbi:hypothetical protein SODALDRAFT_335093 [Sodiomyces alkalinus F11]|uniref:Chitin synthesis regulation, congo red resistance, RCR protein n=1 Tax=Sodiomyces alkalinus (strain CBS 110278 / VKM F-3762 / F11) TaxID=1314773 RepID=A0A3N2PQW9_SODAK|nr:hypothetical protein SODALDRAFT_335093 [Sodiomyces alkalinus F11]ROT36878.1 hypothetical protein SODALDRAFT_335093 [Sodiomyces alkalinus F11]